MNDGLPKNYDSWKLASPDDEYETPHCCECGDNLEGGDVDRWNDSPGTIRCCHCEGEGHPCAECGETALDREDDLYFNEPGCICPECRKELNETS